MLLQGLLGSRAAPAAAAAGGQAALPEAQAAGAGTVRGRAQREAELLGEMPRLLTPAGVGWVAVCGGLAAWWHAAMSVAARRLLCAVRASSWPTNHLD